MSIPFLYESSLYIPICCLARFLRESRHSRPKRKENVTRHLSCRIYRHHPRRGTEAGDIDGNFRQIQTRHDVRRSPHLLYSRPMKERNFSHQVPIRVGAAGKNLTGQLAQDDSGLRGQRFFRTIARAGGGLGGLILPIHCHCL